jgi:hypothetical protein
LGGLHSTNFFAWLACFRVFSFADCTLFCLLSLGVCLFDYFASCMSFSPHLTLFVSLLLMIEVLGGLGLQIILDFCGFLLRFALFVWDLGWAF